MVTRHAFHLLIAGNILLAYRRGLDYDDEWCDKPEVPVIDSLDPEALAALERYVSSVFSFQCLQGVLEGNLDVNFCREEKRHWAAKLASGQPVQNEGSFISDSFPDFMPVLCFIALISLVCEPTDTSRRTMTQ